MNSNKVHNVALQRGKITDNVSGTHQKVNTKFFYNSKVKPAMVEADFARKFAKSRSVNSKEKAIRPKIFWASSCRNDCKCVRGVARVETSNVNTNIGVIGSGIGTTTSVGGNEASVQAEVSALSHDHESMAENFVSGVHPNELPHSTDLAAGLCLPENVASKADDQCSGNSCACQNAVNNDTIEETLFPIYDINYAGMEDIFVTSIMHASHKQKYSDFANVTAPIFKKWCSQVNFMFGFMYSKFYYAMHLQRWTMNYDQLI